VAESELDGGGVKEMDGAKGLGHRRVKSPLKLFRDTKDGGCAIYSIDCRATSGSMLSSPTTEASSVSGVVATTEVVVEDLIDAAGVSRDEPEDCLRG
jgi:hypothetical protein